MNKPEISIIIPKRNTKSYYRDTNRLNDILKSLKNQAVAHKIEVIVSDIDSDEEFRKKHQAVCDKYKAKYVYTKTGKPWNISRARNIGIRNASGTYVMVTDVDIVFAPNFIETVLKYASPRTIVHCRLGDLPKDYKGDLTNFTTLRKDRTGLRPPHCYGGCQVVHKDWAFKVHGYDEEYELWGGDDTDMCHRALQDGLKEIWIEHETAYYHQYHSQENRLDNPLQLHANRSRCKMTADGKLPVVRNPYGWGGKLIESKFPDTAVIITTFLRDNHLFECVKSIRKYYPGLAIYVADGGHHTLDKTTFLEKHHCHHVKLPFDTGVCGSRNEALKVVPKVYKYILICEDDIVFTPESRIDVWRQILDHDSRLGIIGGLMWRIQRDRQAIQHYEGFLSVDKDTVNIAEPKEIKWYQIDDAVRYYYCDIILNVFLMRREVHNDMKWDAKIPQAPEHLDFFLSLKRWTNWKVGYTDNFQMKHVQYGYEGDYLYYRQRNQGFRHFAQKHGIRYVYSDWHRKFRTYPDKVDYLKWEMKAGSVMVHNLVSAVKTLEALDCKWFLGNATCLGVVRDNDFTRESDNINIVLHPGQDKLWNDIRDMLLDDGFELVKEYKYKRTKLILILGRDDRQLRFHFGQEKDVHVWYAVLNQDEKDQELAFRPYVFDAELISKIKPILFKGLKCFIPEKAEKYLEAIYGTWKIPDHDYKSWEDAGVIDKGCFKKHRIAFIPGVWDILHVGHLSVLAKAKTYKAKIIIGILTDEAVKRYATSPVVPFQQRKKILESLKDIDQVITINSQNPINDLKKNRVYPDYVFYGRSIRSTQEENDLKALGAKIITCPRVDGANTARIKKDIKAPQTKKTYIGDERIAVCIKTFLREGLLKKTIKSISRHMPYPYKLYIADDSGNVSDEMAFLYSELKDEGHEIIRLPFNVGLSAGRNAAIKQVKEDYVLVIDDDILLDNPQTITKMRDVLDSRDDMGLVSSLLYMENGNYLATESYQKGLRFEFKNNTLFRHPSLKNIQKTDAGTLYILADQTVNAFLAKRALFNDVIWDDRIKIEWEHIDFFLMMLKTQRWKAAIALDTKMVHQTSIPDYNYNQYRRHAPVHYFLQKHKFYSTPVNHF